jgi:hypothetical protein
MNVELEYVQPIETIKEKHPHIICKQCDKPLIRPIFCENCCDFVCQSCLTNALCCEFSKVIFLSDTNNESINGKGSIAKLLEQLEIYCPINRTNGCEWIGMRKEYFDHCNECDKKYQLCKFGCGIKVDDQHYNICGHTKQWLIYDSQNRCNELNNLKQRNKFKYIRDKIKNSKLKNQAQIIQFDTDNIENQIVIIQNIMTEQKKEISDIKNDFLIYKQIYDEKILELDKIINQLKMNIEYDNFINKTEKTILNPTVINYNEINFDKIRPKGPFDLITESQTYIPKQTGYILIVAVGGGGGAGAGGTGYQGGGGSGYIEVCIVNLTEIKPFEIKIGKGGLGGGSHISDHIMIDSNIYQVEEFIFGIEKILDKRINSSIDISKLICLPNDGEGTVVDVSDIIKLTADGGRAPILINYKYDNISLPIYEHRAGNGFSGGANIGILPINQKNHARNYNGGGGSNGSDGITNANNEELQNGHKNICGKGSKSLIINHLNKIHPNIRAGDGGKSSKQLNKQSTGGGGAGGLFLYEKPIRAENGIHKDINSLPVPEEYSHAGQGGIGFGAGGGGGFHCHSIKKEEKWSAINGHSVKNEIILWDKYYSYNGGNGANGCVIIEYIDY